MNFNDVGYISYGFNMSNSTASHIIQQAILYKKKNYCHDLPWRICSNLVKCLLYKNTHIICIFRMKDNIANNLDEHMTSGLLSFLFCFPDQI